MAERTHLPSWPESRNTSKDQNDVPVYCSEWILMKALEAHLKETALSRYLLHPLTPALLNGGDAGNA